MTTFTWTPPVGAKELDAPSSSKLVVKLYKEKDKADKKGKDVVVISARELHKQPDYICTHYITCAIDILCLCERKAGGEPIDREDNN